jgi:hypothetical protein
MNTFNIFQGVVSLLALVLGVTAFCFLAKRGWQLVLRALQATGYRLAQGRLGLM